MPPTASLITQTDRFGLNINYKPFIGNNISEFVILNEVKNLFLHTSGFIGIILIHRPDASPSTSLRASANSGLKAIFAQHDSKSRSV